MIRAIPYTSLWFGTILWVLLGGSLLAGTGWWLYQDYLFAYDSKPATAVLVRKYLTTSHDKHGTHYTPWLDYRYRTGPISVECRAKVERATYSPLAPGASIPIIFLPAEVASNRIELPAEEKRVQFINFLLVGLSLVTSVGGGFILRYYVRRNRLYQFLRTRGLSCRGTVTSVEFNLVGKAQTKQYYLRFNFRDSQGQERYGSTWYLKRGYESLWSEGQPIQVYFDPADSTKFTVDLKPGLV